MIYSNYRNNMPHYDSMTNNYNPMGIDDYRISYNSRMQIANTMPTMPGMEDMLEQRPFIPETEMPLEIDGNMPALPQMPGMPQQGMPQMPGMPMVPMMPQMPRMPVMTPFDGNMYPLRPGMPNGMPQMPGMPGMPNGMPGMPNGMPGMPQMPGMPNGMPGMPNGMPGMPNGMPGMPEMTCEQLRDMMRRMNCPMSGNITNEPRPIVMPKNGTQTPPQNSNAPATQPKK